MRAHLLDGFVVDPSSLRERPIRSLQSLLVLSLGWFLTFLGCLLARPSSIACPLVCPLSDFLMYLQACSKSFSGHTHGPACKVFMLTEPAHGFWLDLFRVLGVVFLCAPFLVDTAAKRDIGAQKRKQ